MMCVFKFQGNPEGVTFLCAVITGCCEPGDLHAGVLTVIPFKAVCVHKH